MSIKFSEYRLAKASRIVRIRDNKTCQLCLNKFPSKQLQSHHVFPKADYPELLKDVAYLLGLQITLCGKCHIRVVHSDERNVTRFRLLFYSHLNQSRIKQFNSLHQSKVCDVSSDKLAPMEAYGISPGWLKLLLNLKKGK